VIKIDIDGSRLIYHASVVVSDAEVEVWTSDIAVDAAGNAYVTGYEIRVHSRRALRSNP
jgi:hypothetical protein